MILEVLTSLPFSMARQSSMGDGAIEWSVRLSGGGEIETMVPSNNCQSL